MHIDLNGLSILQLFSGIAMSVFLIQWLSLFLATRVREDDAQGNSALRELESLRRILQRNTGRDISQLILRGGRWYAVTSRGEELVSAMLKAGYINHKYQGVANAAAGLDRAS